MIECKSCGIPWAQRRFRQHVSACKGKIQGFSAYYHGRRYMQQCQRCLKPMREERIKAHGRFCTALQHVQDKKYVLDGTLPSILTPKVSHEIEIDNLAVADMESRQDDQQMNEEASFTYIKPELPNNILFHCPLRGETIILDINEDEEIDMTPPKAPTMSELNHQAIQASLSSACATKKKFRSKKLDMLRESLSPISPKIPTVIELCVLSGLLRLIGKYSQQQKWELKKMVVNKKELYDFLKEVQPWIMSNEYFFNIAQEKVKLYEHDDETLIILNFQQLYLRVKQMIEIYAISPSKIERIFTTPLQKRCSLKRRHRRDPDTHKIRQKISRYFSRTRKEKIIRKRKYGMRPQTKLKYEGLMFIASNADKVYQMKELFATKPSINHQKSIMQRRGELMQQFCLKAIADDVTASVILGEFKVWSKKIEDVPPEKRYLYQNTVPNVPAFNIWYPVPESVLRERRWIFLSIYNQCQAHFQSPLPQHTQKSLFQKVMSWYKNNNLISRYNLYEIEEYDEIRALLDHEYRIKQQKKRISRIAAKSVQYAHSMAFHQDQDDSQEKDQARRKMVGDNKKWFLTDEGFNKTAYQVCAFCEESLTYPALTCQQCVSMYHPKCKSSILHVCLCESLYGDKDDETILAKAIHDARTNLKQVSLDIKLPPKASMMELAFQAQQLELHLNPRATKPWSKGSLTFYCDKSTSLNPYSQKITFLNKKSLLFYQKFGTQFVYPGVIVEIPGKGKGVLASRNINKGEIVANYVGRLITDAQTMELFQDNAYIYTFQYGNTPFNTFNIVPDAIGSIGIFINHSPCPNCIGGRYWTDKGPLLIFIAIKKIRMKEQICYDYGKNYPGVQNFI